MILLQKVTIFMQFNSYLRVQVMLLIWFYEHAADRKAGAVRQQYVQMNCYLGFCIISTLFAAI